MLNVVVNGFWGLRGESVPGIAERWSGTLTALKDIDGPTFDVWHEAGDDLPSDPVLEPSVPALVEYIERKSTGPDLDVVGRTASLWAQNPGAARVSMAIHAGSTSHYAVNSVSLAFRSREVDETAEAVRRAPEILRVLAEHWEIDAGQVYDRPQYRAVAERFGLENSDPRCGRAVFLSAGRAALAPEGLPGTYVRTAHGGLVVDLTRGGAQSPSIETIVEANALLRAAGALEKLPQPFDRATF
ncbi:Imm52 family immunity protein [Streptomyces sp. NPDC001732]